METKRELEYDQSLFRGEARMEDDKRRLLTQTEPIPQEMLRELATDGGMQGIINMAKSDGWDGNTPIIMAVHKLDASAGLQSSKWSLQVRLVIRIYAHNETLFRER